MSAQLNQAVHRRVTVTELTGEPVTGLLAADFTFVLERLEAAAMVAVSDAISVVDLGGGDYLVSFTPTEGLGLHVLEISVSGRLVEPSAPFQIEVESGSAAASGPYLTTRAAVKSALGLQDTTENDAAIDVLLAAVTSYVQHKAGRRFVAAQITEDLAAPGNYNQKLLLGGYPITSIVGVWISTAEPRVFGNDELLTEGADYLVDKDAGILIRLGGRCWPRDPASIRVTRTDGYAEIPKDIEQAAIEIIAVKLAKLAPGGGTSLYHQASIKGATEGELSGIRAYDVPPHARDVIASYRDRQVG